MDDDDDDDDDENDRGKKKLAAVLLQFTSIQSYIACSQTLVHQESG